jgi:chromosomal replication initiation ATPase DnaA
MHNPDDDTLKRVLEKIWKDKGIVVDNAILEYLSRRIDRNFPAICQWAKKIDTLSAQQRKPITVSMLHHLFSA